MSVHRYLPASIAGDYAKGAVGLGISAAVLALVPAAPAVLAAFGGMAALFLLFTLRTVARHRARIELRPEAIRAETGLPGAAGSVELPWREIDGVLLRYFSTRRSRDRGWMTMRLSAGRRRLAVNSALEGFDEIAARAALEVRQRGLPLNPTTRANFAALGLDPGGASEPEPAWMAVARSRRGASRG